MKKQVPTLNAGLTRGYLHCRIHSVKVPALNDRSAWLAQLFPDIPLWRTRHTKQVYIQDLLLDNLWKIPLYLQLIIQLHHRQDNEMKNETDFSYLKCTAMHSHFSASLTCWVLAKVSSKCNEASVKWRFCLTLRLISSAAKMVGSTGTFLVICSQ